MSETLLHAHVVLHINATPGDAFNAWLEPAVIERWLFKSAHNSLKAETDPRPGGFYSIVEKNGDEIINHTGTYSIVDHPSHLVFSLVVPKHFSGTAQLGVQFQPEDGGTRLELTATGDGPDDAQPIWERMLGNLARLLEQ